MPSVADFPASTCILNTKISVINSPVSTSVIVASQEVVILSSEIFVISVSIVIDSPIGVGSRIGINEVPYTNFI